MTQNPTANTTMNNRVADALELVNTEISVARQMLDNHLQSMTDDYLTENNDGDDYLFISSRGEMIHNATIRLGYMAHVRIVLENINSETPVRSVISWITHPGINGTYDDVAREMAPAIIGVLLQDATMEACGNLGK